MGILERLSPFKRIAVLEFSGMISSSSIEPYLHIVRALSESRKIAGIVMKMNSGGGSAAATENLYLALRKLSEKKPLYCYVFEIAGSGGFWLACASDKIYASTTAVVGSIGVISLKPLLSEIMEKLGISLEITKKGRHKDMHLFHRKYTREEERKMDELNSEIYTRFCEIVSERRGLEKKMVEKIATGEIFSARKAKEFGLIDGISDMDHVLEQMYAATGVKRGRIVYIKPRPPMLKRILGGFADTLVDEAYERLCIAYI
jgi:protease-4